MNKKKCRTCFGYGFWTFGRKVPIGPIDASDGLPTIQCPECGANANPTELDTCESTIKKRRLKVR